MADFLLEVLSEEIPARMQAKARNDLARLFAEKLQQTGISSEGIETWSTPRRLVLIARGLPEQTETMTEEIKGPRTNASEQALEGFLRKNSLTRDQLVERSGAYFVNLVRPGKPTAEFLESIVPLIIWEFPWPKSMRWGPHSADNETLRWVRPLHGIVTIMGNEVVEFRLDVRKVWANATDLQITQHATGIASGATTVGHRFHHPGPITIGGAHDYVEKLRACHVIVDQDERERLIREGAQAAAAEAGLMLLQDEGLVVENAGLAEWPVPLLGRFDPEFLDVPREVIVLTMRTNQKYFACLDQNADLAPAFVCIANVSATDGGDAIVEGNRRVLAARLADARFFWEQDLKVPLEDQAKRLNGIVFHEKLGTVADKVERVAKLARWLVESGVVKADADQVERAARLAKADLVSGMVGEFPELQGVIGGYLAAAQGEPRAVADAIRDHYQPIGQGDEVPTAPVTVAVALSDKLDSLFSFFKEKMYPTGSKDPFALRRAALGAISIILENGLQLHTDAPAEIWLGQSDHKQKLSEEEIARRSILTTVPHFLLERLQVQQRDQGIRHDLIAASARWSARQDGRLDRIVIRAAALQKFVMTEEGADLLTAYKRAANILKKENWTGPQVLSSTQEQGIPQTGEEDPLVLVEEPILKDAIAELALGQAGADLPEERALISALDVAEPKAAAAVQAEDFTAAMAALASLRKPIDDFFDHVTVNDPDSAKRERRLNLLMRFRDAVNAVADFSRIEG